MQCERTVIKTALTFDDLGYVINATKSRFIPKQISTYLGFIINSIRMTVTLTDEKKTDLKEKLENLLDKETLAIREGALVVGHMVASFLASGYGPLYYRNIERKINALKIANGDFDKHMCLSEQAKSDINCWLENIDTMFAPIHLPPIAYTIYTNSSDIGWGVVFEKRRTGGPWEEVEVTALLILIREMLAVYFAIRSFREMFRGKHIKVDSDNTNTVQVINKMGSAHSIECNSTAQLSWQFCRKRDIWLTCTFLSGSQNKGAGFESRKKYRDAEWMLNRSIFSDAVNHFNFTPDIDCFTSRMNC